MTTNECGGGDCGSHHKGSGSLFPSEPQNGVASWVLDEGDHAVDGCSSPFGYLAVEQSLLRLSVDDQPIRRGHSFSPQTSGALICMQWFSTGVFDMPSRDLWFCRPSWQTMSISSRLFPKTARRACRLSRAHRRDLCAGAPGIESPACGSFPRRVSYRSSLVPPRHGGRSTRTTL